MTTSKILRYFFIVLLLVGTISSVALYFMSYQIPQKIPLRARQVMAWPVGGSEYG
jgi:hypothetical protein